MAGSQLSYFTCTLSDALSHNLNHGARCELTEDGSIIANSLYEDVNGFVDFLAAQYGDHLAIGCVTPVLNSRIIERQEECLTFKEIQHWSTRVGSYLENQLSLHSIQSEWVALLATSSPVFLLVWLGLLRHGYKILLIAPQTSIQSIRHLLRLSQVGTIIYDERYKQTMDDVVSSISEHDDADCRTVKRLQLLWTSIKEMIASSELSTFAVTENTARRKGQATDVVYSFHSSGTTGLPKLIPQTNHGAVGVLPMLQETPDKEGCFSTTPLYSGGIADVFRSWSAAAPLWLFPEGSLPITASNVLSCINAVDDICHRSNAFPATELCYLSCVPFVLESMMEDEIALKRLQEMKVVGVGGAAMPKHLGDLLVAQNVPLVSRFGSSENGFLMSSARDFDDDKQWDLLHSASKDGVEFKKLDGDDDRFELIVLRGWPLVSTAKHARRPFNTHDIFAPHPTQRGYWHYKGRSDAQITLRTGRKFDPTEVETALKASRYIADAVIVGEGHAMPIAFIFTSKESQEVVKEKLIAILRDVLSDANRNVAKYASIDWNYVKILPSTEIQRIPKNSKGGVIRSIFATRFASEIARLYGQDDDSRTNELQENIKSWSSVLSIVNTIVTKQIHSDQPVGIEDNLFEAGLDSQGCITICQQLKASTGIKSLSIGTVYECGTVQRLSEHMAQILGISAETNPTKEVTPQKAEEMEALIRHYVAAQAQLLHNTRVNPISSTHSSERKVFLLTGATGFLGTHILHRLLHDESVDKIFVLIRGSRRAAHHLHAAQSRVNAALSFHRLDNPHTTTELEAKVQFIPTFLRDENIGLSEPELAQIIGSVTHVIHAAWEVNFNLPLSAFTTHIKGTIDLFNVAILAGEHRDVHFTFCSSLASILNSPRCRGVSSDPDDAAPLGYAQSKWVTENILSSLNHDRGVKLKILRIGQLSGETERGIWNAREAWPLMIDASLGVIPAQASRLDGKSCVFPDLASTYLPRVDWLPVDRAADDVLRATVASDTVGDCFETVANVAQQVGWDVVQGYIGTWAAHRAYSCEFVPAQEWLDRLESCAMDHRAKALVPLWRGNWTHRDQTIDEQGKEAEIFENNSKTGRHEFNFGEEYFHRLLSWVADG